MDSRKLFELLFKNHAHPAGSEIFRLGPNDTAGALQNPNIALRLNAWKASLIES